MRKWAWLLGRVDLDAGSVARDDGAIGRRRGDGAVLLVRLEYSLELGGRVEARVIGVLLVVVGVLLGTELLGELLKNGADDAVNGRLLGRVAVPNGDEV